MGTGQKAGVAEDRPPQNSPSRGAASASEARGQVLTRLWTEGLPVFGGRRLKGHDLIIFWEETKLIRHFSRRGTPCLAA